jgi:hypothetical protein
MKPNQKSEAAPEPAGGHTPQSWLWPDHALGKSASRMLREEHNALVNSHAVLLAERDRLREAAHNVEAALLPYRGPDLSPDKTYLVSRAAIQQLRAAFAPSAG